MSKDREREETIHAFLEMVAQSDNIVFFGGAGVSTESGIPDFRSQDGLYRQEWDYPPEEIVIKPEPRFTDCCQGRGSFQTLSKVYRVWPEILPILSFGVLAIITEQPGGKSPNHF